jgi:hypothetical protein
MLSIVVAASIVILIAIAWAANRAGLGPDIEERGELWDTWNKGDYND